MENNVSRKYFLRKCFGVAGMLIGGSAFISSCAPDNDPKAPDSDAGQPKSMVPKLEDCNDVTGITDAEANKREAVQYVEKSPDSSRHCNICQLYIPPVEGEACGTCTLFKGPVAADASCISFAPKVPA